ncbi:MAG: hypothetical protein WCY88_17270 [Spongiibacteraceae bacterium]|jgi:hypothetical protein
MKLKKFFAASTFILGANIASALDAPAGLVPAGLVPGDTFYIIFASSNTLNGAQTSATYIAHAANAAALGTDTSTIAGWTTLYGHDDSTLVTTSAFTATDRPIYNTNADLVASDRATLFSNSQSNAIGYDESGNVNAANIWTGFNFTGSSTGIGDDSLGGNDALSDGCLAGNAAQTDNKWAASVLAGGNGCAGANLGLYILSPLLTVPTPISGSASGQDW